MGEIRFVGPGKTRGYPYPVCKKKIFTLYKDRVDHFHFGSGIWLWGIVFYKHLFLVLLLE